MKIIICRNLIDNQYDMKNDEYYGLTLRRSVILAEKNLDLMSNRIFELLYIRHFLHTLTTRLISNLWIKKLNTRIKNLNLWIKKLNRQIKDLNPRI